MAFDTESFVSVSLPSAVQRAYSKHPTGKITRLLGQLLVGEITGACVVAKAGLQWPMARITVEDCLEKIPSRFILVQLAAKRTRQLLKGAKPLIESDNRDIVIALREIAEGKVRWATPKA